MSKKSNNKKKAKASATATPKQSTSPPAAQQPQVSVLVRCLYRCWRVLWRLVAGAIFVAGLVATILALWGPFWPTAPDFLPGLPSTGAPFDIPFTVTNRSMTFAVRDLSIECHLIYVRTKANNTFTNSVTGSRGDSNLLETNQSRTFVCPFTEVISVDAVVAAQISFHSEYESPWRLGLRKSVDSAVFTLNARTSPARWDIGTPMK